MKICQQNVLVNRKRRVSGVWFPLIEPWKRHGHLHILWVLTFQALKHIQLLQHLTWARSKSTTRAIQYEAQYFSWLDSKHFVIHCMQSSETAQLTGQN